MIFGWDTNEDLSEKKTDTKWCNLHLQEFINECCLKHDSKAKYFVNSLGQKSHKFITFSITLRVKTFKQNKQKRINKNTSPS